MKYGLLSGKEASLDVDGRVFGDGAPTPGGLFHFASQRVVNGGNAVVFHEIVKVEEVFRPFGVDGFSIEVDSCDVLLESGFQNLPNVVGIAGVAAQDTRFIGIGLGRVAIEEEIAAAAFVGAGTEFFLQGTLQEDVVLVVGGFEDVHLQEFAGRIVGADDVGGFPGVVLERNSGTAFRKGGRIGGILGDDDFAGVVGVAVVPLHENVSAVGGGHQRDLGVDIVFAAARHAAHFRVVDVHGNGVLVFLAAKKQHSDGHDHRHQAKILFHFG